MKVALTIMMFAALILGGFWFLGNQKPSKISAETKTESLSVRPTDHLNRIAVSKPFELSARSSLNEIAAAQNAISETTRPSDKELNAEQKIAALEELRESLNRDLSDCMMEYARLGKKYEILIQEKIQGLQAQFLAIPETSRFSEEEIDLISKFIFDTNYLPEPWQFPQIIKIKREFLERKNKLNNDWAAIHKTENPEEEMPQEWAQYNQDSQQYWQDWKDAVTSIIGFDRAQTLFEY